MRRRQPRLGQTAFAEQLAQVASVGTIGLRASLLPPAGARLGGLGKMRPRARLGQRATNEQAARTRLDRDLDLLTRETLDPGANSRRCRVTAAAAQLPRLGIERVERDLSSMHVKPGYDRHLRASFALLSSLITRTISR
jgi:hypothetical protein